MPKTQNFQQQMYEKNNLRALAMLTICTLRNQDVSKYNLELDFFLNVDVVKWNM